MMNSTPLRAQTQDALERGLHAVERASERASHSLAEQAGHAAAQMQDLGREASYQATRMRRQTAGYVRKEPMKALLISAAVGAVAVGLVALFGRSAR
jgi:ElaB/YqjD/DUF883 family membrane-anchored ribosome-binding protein